METHLTVEMPRRHKMVEKIKAHAETIKWGAAIVYMVITTAAIFIQQVSVPRMADGRTLSQAIAIHDVRIDRLEAVALKLDAFEAGAAERTEAITTLKTTVDRIERKIDAHMMKDGR